MWNKKPRLSIKESSKMRLEERTLSCRIDQVTIDLLTYWTNFSDSSRSPASGLDATMELKCTLVNKKLKLPNSLY